MSNIIYRYELDLYKDSIEVLNIVERYLTALCNNGNLPEGAAAVYSRNALENTQKARDEIRDYIKNSEVI